MVPRGVDIKWRFEVRVSFQLLSEQEEHRRAGGGRGLQVDIRGQVNVFRFGCLFLKSSQRCLTHLLIPGDVFIFVLLCVVSVIV